MLAVSWHTPVMLVCCMPQSLSLCIHKVRPPSSNAHDSARRLCKNCDMYCPASCWLIPCSFTSESSLTQPCVFWLETVLAMHASWCYLPVHADAGSLMQSKAKMMLAMSCNTQDGLCCFHAVTFTATLVDTSLPPLLPCITFTVSASQRWPQQQMSVLPVSPSSTSFQAVLLS